MTKPIPIRCRIQPSLVTGHRAEDDGEMVFVICRRGLHAAMGRGFKVGTRPLLKVNIELVDEDPDATERISRQAAGEPQEQ